MKCKNCFNCKMRIKKRKKDLKGVRYGATMFAPKTKAQGLVKLFCAKGLWTDNKGNEKVFKTIRELDNDFFKEFDNCPYYEGEGNREENTPMVNEINRNIKILRDRLTRG